MTTLNSLETYVAETLQGRRGDYDGDMVAILRDARRGIDTGWWTDLIYTHHIVNFFNAHRVPISETLAAFAEEVGEDPFTYPVGSKGITRADLMRSIAGAEITTDEQIAAVQWLVAFAIEWETDRYASRNNIEF